MGSKKVSSDRWQYQVSWEV